ncbi:polyprenyl synthetase family protein [Vagococcus intermedius]|uniref:Polyprenyl synthetase family protein n=1 Tax=Vagococcus intermedius TaxID=2991418 RepID=A0AAF0I610_9ENTE|nr:polyprenyl synthetase family protein [Vagococcus intermedius]WEG73303.1 polyprenyl synthetase family protein [Vagococcus intermedius]WEG75384.1 polyprenyl synthetase family protein [Vagococcus intermedius]
MAIHPLWDKYPIIQKELLETQKIMNQTVKIRNKEMTEALQLFFQSGGKLLRPAYFLIFTKFGKSPSTKRQYQYAASLEVLHAATLVHDDIIDNSPVRRDQPSIQATFGKDIAVYAGDFLFTVYFQLLAASSQDVSSLERNALNMKKILIGELDQLHLKNNTKITIKQYLQHVQGKTAQLFQLSCYEGARFAGSSLRVQILAQRIGYNIGMAFQILDDVLDYSSTEETLHKPVLEDIRNGNYTLPLIYAMQENPQAFSLLETKDNLSDHDIKQLVAAISHYKGIEKAQALATRYTDKALSEINKLPDIPEKKQLIDLTKKLLHRED